MTVNDLMKILSEYPPGMEVKICMDNKTTFAQTISTVWDMDTNVPSCAIWGEWERYYKLPKRKDE